MFPTTQKYICFSCCLVCFHPQSNYGSCIALSCPVSCISFNLEQANLGLEHYTPQHCLWCHVLFCVSHQETRKVYGWTILLLLDCFICSQFPHLYVQIKICTTQFKWHTHSEDDRSGTHKSAQTFLERRETLMAGWHPKAECILACA